MGPDRLFAAIVLGTRFIFYPPIEKDFQGKEIKSSGRYKPCFLSKMSLGVLTLAR